jgi:sugar lactone lactonase YvrE
MEKAHGKVEALCEQCSGDKATAFCRHCTDFICEECVKSHQKLKVFAGHKVTSLEELKKGETREILIKKPPPPTCKDHDEQMKIYCFDCNRLICRDCTMIEHKEHKYDFVKKAAPKTKEKLSDNLAPLKEIQVNLHGATQTIKLTKSAVEAQGESVATTIEQSFNELHEIIEQRKRELLEKAASMTKGKLDRLSVQEKGFEMASGTVQSLVDFVEQNIENATEEELMSIHTQVMNRISEETKKHQCSRAELEPVEEANMLVDVRCATELKKMCQENINVLEYSVDIPVMKYAEVGKPAVIQVSCKSVSPVLIESKLVSVTDGTVIKTTITGKQEQNAAYQIEYVPKVRGRHKLEITANGLPVPGSPFPVFVKIPPTQLGKPVKIIGGVKTPIDIAINSVGELLVAEEGGVIITIDKRGKKVRSIQKVQRGLYGISVDKDDNIYLIFQGSNKLSKFNWKYELVKEIGTKYAWGIVVVKEQVIVGSRGDPKCLHIFDRELNLEKTIDLKQIGVRDIMGIAVDEHMNLYICDFNNRGIHVISVEGQGELLYSFGQQQLKLPHSICTSGGLVYVSTWSGHKIFVFTKEGTLLASFGSQGDEEGLFRLPSGLVLDTDGYLYVCDRNKCRLQLF